jgi:hypothetical protein
LVLVLAWEKQVLAGQFSRLFICWSLALTFAPFKLLLGHRNLATTAKYLCIAANAWRKEWGVIGLEM